MLAGLIPAIQIAGTSPQSVLKGGRTVAGGRGRLRDGLVVAEMARFRAEAPVVVSRRRHGRSEFRLRELLASAFMRRVHASVPDSELEALADQITDRTLDPYTAAAQVLARVIP